MVPWRIMPCIGCEFSAVRGHGGREQRSRRDGRHYGSFSRRGCRIPANGRVAADRTVLPRHRRPRRAIRTVPPPPPRAGAVVATIAIGGRCLSTFASSCRIAIANWPGEKSPWGANAGPRISTPNFWTIGIPPPTRFATAATTARRPCNARGSAARRTPRRASNRPACTSRPSSATKQPSGFWGAQHDDRVEQFGRDAISQLRGIQFKNLPTVGARAAGTLSPIGATTISSIGGTIFGVAAR